MQFGILRANRTEDLLVASNEIVSSYYYFFFLLDFSEICGRISLKFSEVVGTGLAEREFQFDVRTSLPVGDMVHFLFSLSSGFLKNRSRYRAEIFRDCSLVISTLMLRVSLI